MGSCPSPSLALARVPSLRFTFILCLAALGTGSGRGRRLALRARVGAGQRPDHRHLDRHAARRSPAGLRLHARCKTPAIDALAADGVVFERAYSHAPQTLPAHAAILSGRLPFETGVRDNVGFTVKPGERLLPQMLRDRGFATGGVVSAYVLRKETGIGQGFDFFDGDMPAGSPELSIGQVQRDGARVGSDRRALARLDRHRRAPSCSCTSTSRTRRTRRRSASPSTRRTTARSPTPTRSSAGWCST